MSKSKTKTEKPADPAAKKSDKPLQPSPTRKRLTDAEASARMVVLTAQMEKQYGKGIVQNLAGQTSNTRFAYQIPTGSIALDLALAPIRRFPDGRWQTGLTPGRIMEIYGPEGGGKTTLCAQICANAQNMGLRCAYNDMEHMVDPDYFRRLGVNFGALQFTQPKDGTECSNIIKLQVQSGLFDCVFTDSVAAMVPESEMDGDIGDAQMGSHARLMSQSMRQINPYLSPDRGTTTNVFFINQTRNKIGVMFGNPETTTGGNALKFYSSVRVDIRRIESLKDGEDVYGQRVRIKVVKNKVAPPFRQAEVDMVFGRGLDIHADLFDLCVGRSILTAGDSGWTKFGRHTLAQGRMNCVQKIRTNPKLAYMLYDKLLTTVQDERGFLPDGTPIPGRAQEVVNTQRQSVFTPTAEEVAASEVKEEDVVEQIEEKAGEKK